MTAGSRALSYRELARRAGALAGRLRAAGVGPETRVGLCVERSLELPVALLAILEAGGAYVPLDPDYPAERLAFMLRDAGLAVLLVQEELIPALPANDLPQVLLAATGDAGDSRPAAPRAVTGGGERLAYVMYTSGSTGRPNGVAVPHRGVVRLVRETGYAELGPDETFLQLAPISFDASTLEVWGPLLNGGRLAIFPPGVPSLAELGRSLTEQRVTTLWLTAGLFHQVVEEHLASLAGLRQLLAGGDVLAPGAVARVLRETPGCRVINGYGPTENTTFTTCYPLRAGDETGRSVPIGRPIAGTRALVLDGRLAPVPIGVAGELWAAGAGLARGYWGRPRLSAERFVPHPAVARPGERLYRTGDLARHLADGRIEFLGRRDVQVKLRGFRIEPGEVEAALAAHPAVAEAVAVVREDDGEKRLVAYAVVRSGDESADDLRGFLRERLPTHLVPAAVVTLRELPLSPNGKVDRAALPAPTLGAPAGAAVAPRTPVEAAIAAIWAELLPTAQAGAFGVEDDFFDLGGHSLLATRVIARLRETLGVELPLRDFFAEPTIAALARAVTAGEAAAWSAIPRGDGGPAPLSFSQRRLWFLDRFEPESSVYNVPMAVRLGGRLDRPALARALSEIVRRHEVLRTRFREHAGEPVQEATAARPLPLPVADLAALPEAAREGAAQHLAELEGRRSFDLARGPLLRTLLLALGPDDHVLAATLHHVASDGWSIGVLIRELTALYAAFAAGRPSPLPELPIQYADFARWQRRRFDEAALAAEIAFWRQRLDGCQDLELPTDHPRPAIAASRGAARPLALGPRLSAELRASARRAGSTPFAVLLAAFQALLARYSGQDDLTVGTPVAGRRRVEVEGLIGFFVNTLVLRGRLDDDPSFATLLDRAREEALEAFTHQNLPFERLVEILEPERRLDRSPLFQVMLAFQNAPREQLEMPGIRLATFRSRPDTAKFDLTLSLSDGIHGIAGTLEYRSDLFDPATIARLRTPPADASSPAPWQSPTGPSPGCPSSPPQSAPRSSTSGTTPGRRKAGPSPPPSNESPRAPPRPRTPRPWSGVTSAPATAAWSRGRAVWRDGSAGKGSGRTSRSASGWAAPPRCWSRSSASSAPAAPTCLLTRPTPGSGSPRSWRTPTRCWS